MCHPSCRDPRPPAAGVATRVHHVMQGKGLPPQAMTVLLGRQFHVERFAELCYSHAHGIEHGLTKGILADDLKRITAGL